MKELLKKLFVDYHKDVYGYLYSLSHDASLSEELASDVFLEVVKSIAKFRGESDIKTWLFAIARHKWYAYLRQKKRQVQECSVQTEMLLEFCESGERTPDVQYCNQEIVERIYELLDMEPERTKNIVLMRLEGFSFYEIGLKYGISESSARVVDFRTKAKIRQILQKEGFENE